MCRTWAHAASDGTSRHVTSSVYTIHLLTAQRHHAWRAGVELANLRRSTWFSCISSLLAGKWRHKVSLGDFR